MTQKETTTKAKKPVTKKINDKQILQAENAYILAGNDLMHKIISQDFSGRKTTTKDKNERHEKRKVFTQATLNLNTLYVTYVYQEMQALLKKSNEDVVRVCCYELDDNNIELEYDYFKENTTSEEVIENNYFVRSEDNEVINHYFSELPEVIDHILVDLSYKVQTEDGAIYLTKEDTLEQFLVWFDLMVEVQYELEVDLDSDAPDNKEEEQAQE